MVDTKEFLDRKTARLRSWRRQVAWILASAVATWLILVWICSFVLERGEHSALETASQSDARLVENLLIEQGLAQMAVAIAAADTRLVSAARKEVGFDNPPTLEVIESVRERLNANFVYVLDRSGTVVASTLRDDKRLTRNNYAFRPNFRIAMSGKEHTYQAL
jgi:C4-dicarboxylate-specific signal transduction histidine kinase